MRPAKQFFVYIMTNGPKPAVLTGVTGNLCHRVWQHKGKLIPGFTSRYNLTRLVYYERFFYPDAAISREKEIKGWRRSKKIALIESMNPHWEDLAKDWEMSTSRYEPQIDGRSLAPLVKARGFGMTPPCSPSLQTKRRLPDRMAVRPLIIYVRSLAIIVRHPPQLDRPSQRPLIFPLAPFRAYHCVS
jgi:putative endonuclease